MLSSYLSLFSSCSYGRLGADSACFRAARCPWSFWFICRETQCHQLSVPHCLAPTECSLSSSASPQDFSFLVTAAGVALKTVVSMGCGLHTCRQQSLLQHITFGTFPLPTDLSVAVPVWLAPLPLGETTPLQDPVQAQDGFRVLDPVEFAAPATPPLLSLDSLIPLPPRLQGAVHKTPERSPWMNSCKPLTLYV